MTRSSGRTVQQRTSHHDLCPDRSSVATRGLRPRATRLDAIVVPASRPASTLQPAIDLAVENAALLVVLCSKEAAVEQVAVRVARTAGARCLVVNVPAGWSLRGLPSGTSDEIFRRVQAGRSTDLSLKRNLGLVLARLHGWRKVVFLDDDITRTASLDRLAGQLEFHQVAGMRVTRHPDNSVVCHARRVAGMEQDVFVSGAVLGVDCDGLPLSFFPDIYNEDWFFFAEQAAARRLPCVGEAYQLDYNPFASPKRAGWEEFGDLLAEGLFALFGEARADISFGDQLTRATSRYWGHFIEARHEVLRDTRERLRRIGDADPGDRQITAALDSLATAENLLGRSINGDLCVSFLEAWREDLHDWQVYSSRLKNVGSTREAMDFLGLRSWRLAEFGAAEVDDVRGARRLTTPAGV